MGWRRPGAAWIGEYGGGGGGSTVSRALLAGNGLGVRGVGALPFYRRRRRERVSWGRHSRRKLQLGQLSRGRRGLGTSLGHGDGVASRGTCRGRAAPGVLVWGESGGDQCGLGLGLGTCPPRWPAPAYGVASGRGAGRREVEEPASGNLVNKPKFQNQFCNFKFSPSSWLQMKKC